MDPEENVTETLNETMWLEESPSPPYNRLSPSNGRQDVRNLIVPHQVSMGYHQVSEATILWQDKHESPKHSPDTNDQLQTNVGTSRGNSPMSEQQVVNYHQIHSSPLKRRSIENHHHLNELDRKISRRDGSVGSNGSTQIWTSKDMEEYAETFVADFDGSLAAITQNDITIGTYGISEALLALPSLTVFKQEAPSPENHANNQNSSLNHVTQRSLHSSHQSNGNIGLSVEPDSNNPGNLVTTTIVSAPPTNRVVNNVSNGDNNPTNNTNRGRGQSTATNLHQLLYTSNDDYTSASSSGNQVSSSQQGNEVNENNRFQYVLAASTSIAMKRDDETLTYLNQGQSYEIKLKKLGDLSAYRGKILKSTIRISFHERRLQFTERELLANWEVSRPNERLIEVDVPLSYGMFDLVQSPAVKNCVDFRWDPTKEVGVYIKINCISTEFTQKKHGGEKGVPFRIRVDTLLPNGPRLHAASCQVKVFKLKGADRKHKQDSSKNRPAGEYQEQQSCTILKDIQPLSPQSLTGENSPYMPGDAASPQSFPSPSGSVPLVNGFDSERDINGCSSPERNPKPDLASSSSPNPWELTDHDDPIRVKAWLHACHFEQLEGIFSTYWGNDMINLTEEKLVDLCGKPEGIRLYNAIHPKPKRVLRFAMESDQNSSFRLIRLFRITREALTARILSEFNLPNECIHSIEIEEAPGKRLIVTEDSIHYLSDWNLIKVSRDSSTGRFDLLLKPCTAQKQPID